MLVKGSSRCVAYTHKMSDLRSDQKSNRLTGTDGTHTEGALSKVSKRHVLAESHRRTGGEGLLHVDACRVDLIEECEAAVWGDAASC